MTTDQAKKVKLNLREFLTTPQPNIRRPSVISTVYNLGTAIVIGSFIIFVYLPHSYPINKTGILLLCAVVGTFVALREKIIDKLISHQFILFYPTIGFSLLLVAMLIYFSGGMSSPFFFLYFVPIIGVTWRFGSQFVWFPLSLAVTSVSIQYLSSQNWKLASVFQPINWDLSTQVLVRIFSLTLIGLFTYLLIRTQESSEKELQTVIKTLAARSQELEIEKNKGLALATTMSNVDDGIYLVDWKENVIAWNKAMESLTGLTDKNVLGKNIYSIVKVYNQSGEKVCTCPKRHDNSAKKDKNPAILFHHQSEAYVNNRHLYVDHVSIPLYNSQGEFSSSVEIFQNASKHRQLELVCSLAQITKSLSNFDETLKEIVHKIARFTKVQKAFIFIYDDDGTVASVKFYGISAHEVDAYKKLSLYTDQHFPSTSADDNFYANQATQDPRLDKLTTDTFKINKYLRYQLKIRGKLIGTLALINKKHSDFSNEDLAILDSTCVQIAAIIENSKLYDNLKKSIEREHQFITDVAHELKTPLTTLRYEAETSLQKNKSQKEYQETLSSMLSGINSLSSRLKNILDLTWSIIDGGKSRALLVDLTTVVSEVEEIAEKLGAEKRIKVEGKLERSVTVKGNKERLAQALINLADNAIKFTPQNGHIKFRVWLQNSSAKVQIKDDGIGICNEDLPYIFDRFYRGKTKTKDLGSGLGLAITKSIITAHHGQIEANSKVGKGTTFTISLPTHKS